MDWKTKIPNNAHSFRIGVNGNYLLSALQAAKISCGNTFRNPVVLEFRGEKDAIILRTNKEDIKLVLPVKIHDSSKA